MKKRICVYSSSSDAVANGFVAAARELGALIGRRQYTLIFGAGNIGLMGQVAGSVHEHGGKVIGVIPQYLNQFGITYEKADELIVTADMRERKAVMEKQADAFIALPGGFGTLEEILEVITLKQLQLHRKPIVFLNTLHFYDNLLLQFRHLFQESFARKSHQQVYAVVDNARQAMDYIETYEPPELQKKWF
jgi:uncharacterized protein (TIGR00730 family)